MDSLAALLCVGKQPSGSIVYVTIK